MDIESAHGSSIITCTRFGIYTWHRLIIVVGDLEVLLNRAAVLVVYLKLSTEMVSCQMGIRIRICVTEKLTFKMLGLVIKFRRSGVLT